MFGLFLLFAGAAFVAIKGLETANENAVMKGTGGKTGGTTTTTPADTTPSFDGWPKDGPSFDYCNQVMKKIADTRGKDIAGTLIKGVLEMTPAKWAEAKKILCKPSDPLSMDFCACMDSTRAYTAYMIENKIMEGAATGSIPKVTTAIQQVATTMADAYTITGRSTGYGTGL